MKKATQKDVKKAVEPIFQYTKKQLLKSQKYFHRQDAINALLKDGEEYTIEEVDKILSNFMKGVDK